MFDALLSRLQPPPPPPLPPAVFTNWAAATLETKLIAALVIVSLTANAAYLMGHSNGVSRVDTPPAAPPPVLHGAVAFLLLGLFCSPGSIDALRMMLWTPGVALPVPPGIVLIVLCASLVLAVSFTSTIYGRTDSATPPAKPAAVADAPSLPSAASTAHLIATRRSIFPKDFDGPVPRAAIERALAAANWAPTHGKTQPWRFCVFYGARAIERFEGLKRAATSRSLAASPDKLEAALSKMHKKGKDVAKCAAVVCLVCKRVAGAKGNFMPEWEDTCAVACAVQNFHLQLTAEGFCGYWSSGGVGGWADDPEVRALVGASPASPASAEPSVAAADTPRDSILGWFHVGACTTAGSYKARRDPIAEKTTWLTE